MSVTLDPKVSELQAERIAYAREFAAVLGAYRAALMDAGVHDELADALTKDFAMQRVRPAVFKYAVEQLID